MKKHLLLTSLFIIPFLASCNNSRINTPKSPFKDDKYVRIGMKGTHKITEPMTNEEYSKLKLYTSNKDKKDFNVTKYHRQEEDRDLKYAYFGKESSTISRCTLTSVNGDLNRYSNRVFIDTSITNKEVQTANAGIQKTKTTLTDYTFDSKYREETKSGEYQERLKTKINNEDEKVEQIKDETTYTEGDVYQIFGLKPFANRISAHFSDEFKLLGDNAVYGKTRDGQYVIKEGYSHFIDFSTTMGRTYKAVDNYFYEGLLEKDTINPGYSYRFLNFRFYHELLILSKAFSDKTVPILYLDKPALIAFTETTYSDITYDDEGESHFPQYSDIIPDVTK